MTTGHISAALQQYSDDLLDEVLTIAELEGDDVSRTQCFTQVVMEQLVQFGEIEDGRACRHRERGMDVSGWGEPEDGGLDLFVTVFRQTGEPGALPRAEMETAFRRLKGFIDACTGGLADRLPPNAEAREMAGQVADLVPVVDKIRCFLITDGIAKVEHFQPEQRGDTLLTFHVWDLKRLQQASVSGHEPIEIDFVERYGSPLRCLAAPGTDRDYDAYLMILPGSMLDDLYEEFGFRLLELNVRSFLQLTGKVNRGIRDTILNEPGNFLAFNNGISATATDVETVRQSDGSLGIRRITDLQIVNGGQTTASVHHASRKLKADVSAIHVQAKLSVVEHETSQEMIKNISRYANSQNKVNDADLEANSPYHRRIEELSRTVFAPPTAAVPQRTRWFYERARSAYRYELAKAGTPAAQRRFKAENPKAQMFSKTDLAKYEHSWSQLPHTVSMGAQKNFVAFHRRLEERKGFVPDATDFTRLVAKAILFRRTEKLVSEEKFGGYRANIVTYTVAWLAWRTAQLLDLDLIWKEQALTPATEEAIRQISRGVFEVIINPPGGQNVSEWCKKEPCWKRVQEIEVDLPEELFSELISRDKARSAAKVVDRGIDGADERDQELINSIAQIPADTWYSLARWAKDTDNLKVWERSLAFSLGRVAARGNVPSRKQAGHGQRILNEAKLLGFSVNIPAP